MLTLPPVELYTDLLPWPEFCDESANLTAREWKYVCKTPDQRVKYLNIDLSDNKFYTEYMLGIINARSGKNFKIHRVYANGQFHSQNGILHIDDICEEAWTFIQYMNDEWYVTWGGSTVFFEEGVCSSITPIPNAGILFKSNILHGGLEPTRDATEMRMTVAYKLLEVT